GEIVGKRHARGIAQKFGAVEIGALHRLDYDMKPRRRVELAEWIALEDVKHLDQGDAARGGRRHGNEAIATVTADFRRALDRLVAREIVARHDAAGGLNRRRQSLSGLALIKRARTLARDGGKRIGEGALPQRGARRGRSPVGFEKNLGRGRPAREPRLRAW